MKKFFKAKYFRISLIAFIIAFSTLFIYSYINKTSSANASPNVLSSSDQKNLLTFTAETLKKYNGTDLSIPIYLALDGYVYDISKGSEFYKVGGPYHYLAGKDSSFELHMVGGDIIKRKYPIIGRFISSN